MQDNLNPDNEQEKLAWNKSTSVTLAECAKIYQRLEVALNDEDVRGESKYNDDLPKVVADVKSKGIATDSEGAVAVFIDGPDKTPLIIQKSDGGYLYGTTDLAAIRYRIDTLHAERIIYTHDSRQAQHFPRSSAPPTRRAGHMAEK